MGRRSLVLHVDMKKELVSISSAYKTIDNASFTIESSSTIQISPEAYHVLYENSCNSGVLSFKDIPPYGVFTIRHFPQIEIGFISTRATDTPCLLNPSSTLEEDRRNSANQLLDLLEKSIWKRISTYDSADVQPQYELNQRIIPSICVMFSGGIDCCILACLLCRVLQDHHLSWVVELVNIAYGEQIEKKEKESLKQLEQSIPDRYTSCIHSYRITDVDQSFADLLHLFPSQEFHFVEINVPNQEVIQHESDILQSVFV